MLEGFAQTESDLIEKLLNGDEAAYASLVESYTASMLRLARVFVTSQAVAEEVVQETWVAVFRGLRSFQGRSKLRTWIFRILTNRAKTRGVKERRSIPFTSLLSEGEAESTDMVVNRLEAEGRWSDPEPSWHTDTPERLALLAESQAVVEVALVPPG